MTDFEKINCFNKELDYIKNEKIRNFTIDCLKRLPEYFYAIPASSTGKYHPTYALGEGGLVRHTKAACGIAYELFKISFFKYSADEKDCIIAALILHDSIKLGTKNNKYTQANHPLLAAQFIESTNYPIDKSHKNLIEDAIKTHMGGWNMDYKTGEEILPLPKTQIQKFVHICDFLASRKCLEYKFDNV